MINAIGAMHATLRSKKRPDEEPPLQVDVKKRRRKPSADESENDPLRQQVDRGRTA